MPAATKAEVEKTLVYETARKEINEKYSKTYKETAEWLSSRKVEYLSNSGYFTKNTRFFGSFGKTYWIPVKKPGQKGIEYYKYTDIRPSIAGFLTPLEDRYVDVIEGWLVGKDRINAKKLLEKRGGAFGY